jgi:hypothetical protein
MDVLRGDFRYILNSKLGQINKQVIKI